MWYIFPQIAGLGRSSTAQYYAIKDIDEARAYLAHPVLGKRLIEISNALIELNTRNAYNVFGYPDCLKLKSCMTLFETANPSEKVFARVLEEYYQGQRDQRTLHILNKT